MFDNPHAATPFCVLGAVLDLLPPTPAEVTGTDPIGHAIDNVQPTPTVATQANGSVSDTPATVDLHPIPSPNPGGPIMNASPQETRRYNEVTGAIDLTTAPMGLSPVTGAIASSMPRHSTNKLMAPTTPVPAPPAAKAKDPKKKRYQQTQKMVSGPATTARCEVHSPH